MKNFYLPLVFSFLVTLGYSQVKKIEVTHYLFPEFKKGTVLMKNGLKNEANLNYNSLTEEMVFENKGTKLAMTQKELVDTVYIDGRKFLPTAKNFIELIYKSKYELYADHKCSIKDPGKPAAYGGTSQTSSSTSYSSFLANGKAYELQLPVGTETNPSIDYWIKKDGVSYKFLSLRQLSKLFEDKKELFKEYVSKNNVKYEKQQSLIDLIRFLETH